MDEENKNNLNVDEEVNENNQNEEKQQDEKALKKEKGKVTRRNVLIIGLIIIIILLLLVRCGGKSVPGPIQTIFDLTNDPVAETGNFKTKTAEEIQEELNKVVDEGMMNISMNLNPVFATGTSEGNLMIMNEEINRYPQVVEIYLNDDEETLVYRSGLIPVGSRIENAKLSVDLDPGEYSCIAYFNAVDPETGAGLGKAGAQITLKVEG